MEGWKSQYLISLRDKYTTCNGKRYAATMDIVLVHNENHPRIFWTTTLKQPVQFLYPLELIDLGTVENENAEKVEV